MICEAVSKLKFAPDDLAVTILRQHEDRFKVQAGLAAAFGFPVRVVILEKPTKNQSETVAETVMHLGLKEPFLVKDSDNCFGVADVNQSFNYVCYDSLNNHDLINPKNKSYLQQDSKGNIINIKEKVVISDTFSTGGYHFSDPDAFLEYYKNLSERPQTWSKELYLSDIVSAMILDGHAFRGMPVTEYEDWGTLQDWQRALLRRKGYFVLLDGFVFERGSEHFYPRFEDVKPNAAAIEAIKELRRQGQIVQFMSVRPESYAELTRKQLEEAGLGGMPVTYNCPMSRWEMITSPSPNLPFRTSEAYELHPDDNELLTRLS